MTGSRSRLAPTICSVSAIGEGKLRILLGSVAIMSAAGGIGKERLLRFVLDSFQRATLGYSQLCGRPPKTHPASGCFSGCHTWWRMLLTRRWYGTRTAWPVPSRFQCQYFGGCRNTVESYHWSPHRGSRKQPRFSDTSRRCAVWRATCVIGGTESEKWIN